MKLNMSNLFHNIVCFQVFQQTLGPGKPSPGSPLTPGGPLGPSTPCRIECSKIFIKCGS